MKPSHGTPFAVHEARFLAALQAAPHGLSSTEVGAMFGLGRWRAVQVLRALRDQGLAVTAPCGGAGVPWATPDRIDAALADWHRRARDNQRALNRKSDARSRARRRARKALDVKREDGPEDLPLQHVHRAAGTYEPMRVATPRCVFTFAQAA